MRCPEEKVRRYPFIRYQRYIDDGLTGGTQGEPYDSVVYHPPSDARPTAWGGINLYWSAGEVI